MEEMKTLKIAVRLRELVGSESCRRNPSESESEKRKEREREREGGFVGLERVVNRFFIINQSNERKRGGRGGNSRIGVWTGNKYTVS